MEETDTIGVESHGGFLSSHFSPLLFALLFFVGSPNWFLFSSPPSIVVNLLFIYKLCGGRSKWLHDGSKGEWMSPAISAARNYGSNGSVNLGSSMQKQFQNNNNEAAESVTGGGSKVGDKANDERINYIKGTAFFQNPQLFFPVKPMNGETKKQAAEINCDEVMGDVVIVDLNRKKRQRGDEVEVDPHETSIHASSVDGNGTPAGGATENSGGATSNLQKNQHFLLVGPGNQAYQDQ